MDLLAERGRRVTVDELNTTRLLAHARKQAVQRNLDDITIVDVDAHHYENENFPEILPFMENEVLKQLNMGGRAKNGRAALVPTHAGFTQDMGGRVTRYPMRGSEKTDAEGGIRDVQLGHALDGRDERRLFLSVPDRHAQHRSASAEGDGGRSLLGLQSVAHREGPPGVEGPFLFDAVPAVLRS